MKKLNFLLLAGLLFAFTSVFMACGEDDDDPATSDPLEVIPSVVGTPEYLPGTEVEFSVKITSGEKLKELDVMALNQSIYTEPKDLNNLYSTTVVVKYLIPADANAGDKIVVSFIVTDKKTEKTATQEITVAAEETPLSEGKNGVIYHILGAEEGAWDLVNDVAKKSSDDDADKDMVNTTTTESEAGTYFFEAKWKSLNSTKFVAANDFDYENATVQAAETAYGNGTAVTETPEVNSGDIFIAKLRDGDQYIAIKVEEVNLTPNNDDGTFDNNDNIVFSYKKASLAKNGGKTLMTYR